MKKVGMMAVALLSVAAAGLAFGGTAHTMGQVSEKIADGVYIGTIAVGGMTADEAMAAVDAYAGTLSDAIFTFTVDDRSVEVSSAEFGISFTDENVVKEAVEVGRSGNLIKRYKDKKDLENGDKIIPMVLSADQDAIKAVLEEESEKLNQDAINCGLTHENGQFVIVDGQDGISVNVEESAARLAGYISTMWDGRDAEFELSADIVEPKGTKEQLSRIKDVLGTYTTNYSDSGANRCTNISVATGKIDGTVLYPGDEFSVGQTISPLTAAGGYELAGAYENGQTVESYGGGVCQVSTTLYNAVILAELDVTQRSNHSMIVTYVKPSMDAAIAGDYKDLKFVNNYDVPIYIEGYTSGKNVTFTIYGEETRPSNRVVTYESDVISQTPGEVQLVATTQPAGYVAVSQTSHTGYVAQLWKVVTVDGVEQSREQVNKSTYKATPRIIQVGTASDDPNVTAAINAAIATGDEATVRAAAAPYAESAAAAIAAAQAQAAAQAAAAATAEEQAIVAGDVQTGQQ